MTTMITEVYDALRSANADEALARRAAEVLANYDDGFGQLDRRLQDLRLEIQEVRTEFRTGFQGIRGELRLLKWQVGVIGGVLVVVGLPALWLLLRIAAKVGAMPG